ncbi:hypothetical protein [Emticicia sp. 17c]|uniref:hypothetical protein n=1 Tax=Emticicia sp. 17c TaxID=3127704 RepID=UPI00301B7C2E
MILFKPFLFAHSPDLSSLMIYEQKGKNFIVIKSSLAAFEGEVIYRYGKDAYKTPQEFKMLAIKHFSKSCFVVINNDTIKLTNPQIQLGHETTLFAELENVPQKITAYHIKNILFKDMPNNQCELILSHKGLPQKQFILNNENKHEVKFRIEKNNWLIEENTNSMFEINKFILDGSILFIIFTAIVFIKRKIPTNNPFDKSRAVGSN